MSAIPRSAQAKAEAAPMMVVGACSAIALVAVAVAVVAARFVGASIWPTEPLGYWALVGAMGALGTALVTVGLVIVATVGLRSLHMARTDLVLTQRSFALAEEDLRIRSRREAMVAAIACCREFGDTIIPANNPLRFMLPPFVQDPAEVVFNTPREVARLAAARVWVDNLRGNLYGECIAMLNRLEAWAMPLTHAVADEAAAYGPCGPVYLSMVLNFYPMLIARRADPGSGNYPNVVRLFEGWFVAQTEAEQAENLKMVKAALEEQKAAEERNAKAKLAPALGLDARTDIQV